MPKSVITLFVALIVGIILALTSLQTSIPTGWIGGLTFVSWTVYSRKQWLRRRETDGLEPSAPERIIRFYAVGTALLFGHSITAITYPNIDIHVGSGNYLAIDSWSMIAFMLLASLIIRQDNKICDERGEVIIARGNKFGFITLIAILVIFSIIIGFLPPRLNTSLTPFMIGNMLIAIIVASLLIKYIIQLIEYEKDTNANFTVGADE